MNEYSKHLLKKHGTKTWPFIIDKNIFNGEKYNIPEACTKCKLDFACQTEIGISTCGSLIKKYTKTTKKRTFTAIILNNNNNFKAIDLWVEQTDHELDEIDKIHLQQRSNDLHNLHDVIKFARQIGIVSEKLIEKSQNGKDFNEKLKNAESEIKTLYNASRLIEESFEMMSILLNPEKVHFGKKIKTSLFKMMDKIRAIYNTTGSNKRIKLAGPSHNFVEAYQSIAIVGHALLQNAIKYSTSDEIEVFVSDVEDGVEVRVVSFGPYIDHQEQKKIFNKGYRSDVAKTMHYDGMGVGLFIAQLIVSSHNSFIEVNSHALNQTTINGHKIAQNTFFFVVPFSISN